ncbi:MAG: UPF0182 family protein [SAR202 cluster bacterium]|nr:UPF0182 family protein [SAR202 cluster bacterium]|tara:strand:+ start:13995 stop:16805 length:2811 start_codon:yes stop_codon:yes gene_type:complete
MNFQEDSGLPFSLSQINQLGISRYYRWIFVILAAFLIFVPLYFLQGLYTDYLWFSSLGFSSVFITVLTNKIILFFIGALIFAFPAIISFYFARKFSWGPVEILMPESTFNFLNKAIIVGMGIFIGVSSTIFGVLLARSWETVLKFFNSSKFGVVDPILNKDLAFYIFDLPFYELVQNWILSAILLILVGSLLVYFVNYTFRGMAFKFNSGLKIHFSILFSLFMVVVSISHFIQRWKILHGSGEIVSGAAYSDVFARMPGLTILGVIALMVAVIILVNIYFNGIRLLIAGVALWGVAAIILTIGWPNAVQRFTVTPNEYQKESPYIDHSIKMTKIGFGIQNITEVEYPVEYELDLETVQASSETIGNVRLWDHAPLLDVYKQIQLIRPYYDFNDVDVDRYTLDGKLRQVMLAAREVNVEKLDDESDTWVNNKLRYTHGFGLSMSPVTEFTSEGRPKFFAKDIPLDGEYKIMDYSAGSEYMILKNPRIYYGEKTTEYIIANSDTDELDFQAQGGEIMSNHYSGSGGVGIGSFFRKLLYAIEMRDLNILISNQINSDTKILYDRNIQERINNVMPFIGLDKDPYLVVGDGNLVWMQDAYTFSNRFPYSDKSETSIDNPYWEDTQFSYIRNSIKISVDAYSGKINAYIWDDSDPIAKVYKNIFPDLFIDRSEMPEYLLNHVRYPQDLFSIQSEKYLKFHMDNSLDFYNLEDVWDIPDEKVGQSDELQDVLPYYAIMKIPGMDTEKFTLLIPYTRNDPPIMSGWLAAGNDGDDYGKLTALLFPKDRQVDSTRQIEARIDNDLEISPELTLLCQQGSICLRGNLLVLPLSHAGKYGLLYVEPIYLQAEGVDFPELKKVIIATQEKVVMEDSVPNAINALLGTSGDVIYSNSDSDAQQSVDNSSTDIVKKMIESLKDKIEGLKKTLNELENSLNILTESLEEK